MRCDWLCSWVRVGPSFVNNPYFSSGPYMGWSVSGLGCFMRRYGSMVGGWRQVPLDLRLPNFSPDTSECNMYDLLLDPVCMFGVIVIC